MHVFLIVVLTKRMDNASLILQALVLALAVLLFKAWTPIALWLAFEEESTVLKPKAIRQKVLREVRVSAVTKAVTHPFHVVMERNKKVVARKSTSCWIKPNPLASTNDLRISRKGGLLQAQAMNLGTG